MAAFWAALTSMAGMAIRFFFNILCREVRII
jgi:hypothetical protein